MAANLVFLNYEQSAMLVIPISTAGVELFLTATSFFSASAEKQDSWVIILG